MSEGFPLDFDGNGVELEVLDSTTLAPGDERERIPFLAPRSANAAKGKAKPLFFHSAEKPVCSPRQENQCKRRSRSQSASEDEHEEQEEEGGETISATAMTTTTTTAISAVYQAENDKTYLQLGLEDLLHANTEQGETLPFCSYLLQRYFNISSGRFRPHQQAVCLSVLQGTSTLAVCPTGWGKSLCYQFPMLVHRLLFMAKYKAWEDASASAITAVTAVRSRELPQTLHSKFCIVVSPLLSLIADQMEKIRDCGCLKAITISSQVAGEREAALLHSLASPTSDVDILFTSPEKYLGSVPLRRLLLGQSHRVAMVCVDEVHCVSRWAFDFRPSFMYVSRVLDDLLHTSGGSPGPKAVLPFLCLTATATKAVITDIERDFRIERTVIAANQCRDNLHLDSVDLVERQRALQRGGTGCPSPSSASSSSSSTAQHSPPSQRVIQDALVEAVREMPKPMIVYVHSRADADELSSYLSSKVGTRSSEGGKTTFGSEAGVFSSASARAAAQGRLPGSSSDGRALVIRCYHAALSRHLRTVTQQQFITGSIDVLVATVAFGMGIDKADIRSVVHAYAPGSLESYVQEIGRSGRDGLPSFCRVLYNPFDFYSLRCRALTSLVSPQEMRAMVQCIFRNPVTAVGDRLMLVCPFKIAEELFLPEETVETLLFLMVTGHCTSSAPIFKRIRGCYPIGFKVVEVLPDGEGDGASGLPHRRQGTGKRKRTTASRFASGADSAEMLANSGVSFLLAQLQARDPLLEVLRGRRVVENQVAVANEAGMSWEDAQFRLRDLQESGVLRVSRLTSSTAYLIEVGDGFTDAACPAGQDEISAAAFTCYNARLTSMTESLKTMFRVLSAPTHEGIQEALEWQQHTEKVEAEEEAWSPPSRSLTKVEAVSIANDFVVKNGIRLRSTYEAARCLLGIMPKSLIKHGKYAGQIPLALSWYVSSPYFGTLREFDVEWVLAILKPHQLDAF